MYIVDIKIFAKNEKQQEIQIARTNAYEKYMTLLTPPHLWKQN